MPEIKVELLFNEEGTPWGMFCYATNVMDALDAFVNHADLDGVSISDITPFYAGQRAMYIMPSFDTFVYDIPHCLMSRNGEVDNAGC